MPQVVEYPPMVTAQYNAAVTVPSYAQYSNAQYSNATAALLTQQATYNDATSTYPNPYHSTTSTAGISRHTVTTTNNHNNNHPQVSTHSPAPPVIVSKSRTVFLSNLPYHFAWQSLKDLLQRFGHVERCNIPKDKRDITKNKGIAIAEYATSDQAARAIKSLNGKKIGAVVIRAKFDRDSGESDGSNSGSARGVVINDKGKAPAGARSVDFNKSRREENGATAHDDQKRCAREGPLIVNGSRGNVKPNRSRCGSKEEQDSSEDEDDEDDHYGSNNGE